MSVIKVENLTFSYPSSYDNIFENVNFTIDTDWKLGFVGRNGRGKTTFLKLLTGVFEYRGKITSSVKFDYFPYRVKNKSFVTSEVLHELCPSAEEWEFVRELSYLEVDADALYRPFDTLSNGEQTKALLAALFLSDGHFPLIDEPTNHLDARAREIVSEYLNKKKGFILVSHDRRFLDGCVDHILSINRANIEVQSGNFSSFSENFEQRQQFERKQNDRLKKDIKRLQEATKRTERWADDIEKAKIGAGDKGYVGHCSAIMMKRAKAIENRRNKAIEEKSALLKNAEYESRLKMFPLVYKRETLASFSDVSVSYDGRRIFSSVSFGVERGERIALCGKNGCGKSSILKLLCGAAIEHCGCVKIGSGLAISYIPQDTSQLKGNLAELYSDGKTDESLFKAVLHKMGFEKRQYDKDMSEFSDGQKKKIMIARSLCSRAHLYVWDEPLNFIDVYSRMQIEDLICEYNPTMVFVEHDKAFCEKIATRVINL